MRRLWNLLRLKVARRPRNYRPEVGRLEGRELPTTVISLVTVTPSILNPPNNSYRQVNVTGYIEESNLKVTPNASFQVIDDYRQFQPLGKITLKADAPYLFSFSFNLTFQAKRVQEYPSGRHYYILIKSADNMNAVGVYKPVIVPLDKLKPGQTTIPSTVQKVPPPKTPKPRPVKTTSTFTTRKHAPVKSSSNSLFGNLF